MAMKKRAIIGLIESVTVFGKKCEKKVEARVDTGATKSSIDIGLADTLGLGPIIKSKVVKSAHGSRLRPIIEAEIRLSRKKMRGEFSLIDRSHMRYPILIGQNILKKNGFLIDPCKKVSLK